MILRSYSSQDSSGRPTAFGLAQTRHPLPFITISPQVGVELPTLPDQLTRILNSQSPDTQTPWSAWDRQIIDKVASEYHIRPQTIEQLEHNGYSWLDTFVSGLGAMSDDYAIVHRLRDVVQSLATQGCVVLVGHGSVFMTSDLPHGTHIRLVAPLSQRIDYFARRFQTTRREAADRLQQAQLHWTAFLRKYWPTHSLAPETFAATLNAGVVAEDRIIDCIVSLVQQKPTSATRVTQAGMTAKAKP